MEQEQTEQIIITGLKLWKHRTDVIVEVQLDHSAWHKVIVSDIRGLFDHTVGATGILQRIERGYDILP